MHFFGALPVQVEFLPDITLMETRMSSREIATATFAGRVERLFRKERRGEEMVELADGEEFECIPGFGIQGDVHAHRLSPRQILITLQSELEDLKIEPGALFENLVISTASPEAFRPGTAITTDKGVHIDLTMFCEPCQRILPVSRDLGAMIGRRGVLGYFRRGGTIAQGDGIILHANHHAALPESPYQKFLDFVPMIPSGKVVRYQDLAIAMGVANSFVRALPGYIKRSAATGIPLHRIVNSRGGLLACLPLQATRLSQEGVRVEQQPGLRDGCAWVRLENYLWQG